MSTLNRSPIWRPRKTPGPLLEQCHSDSNRHFMTEYEDCNGQTCLVRYSWIVAIRGGRGLKEPADSIRIDANAIAKWCSRQCPPYAGLGPFLEISLVDSVKPRRPDNRFDKCIKRGHDVITQTLPPNRPDRFDAWRPGLL